MAFDADDTLWDCQSAFDNVERDYCRLLAPWGSEAEISEQLFQTEKANMPSLGYGVKAFTLSLVENAVRVSDGKISGTEVAKILSLGRTLLNLPAKPLKGVTEGLRQLRSMKQSRDYSMVVFTKGELQDQENKLKRSGLSGFFDDVVIVADKTEEAYRQLCRRFSVGPNELIMVGNSFKSDVEPALSIGAWAVHIPYHVMWRLETSRTYSHERLIETTSFADIPRLTEPLLAAKAWLRSTHYYNSNLKNE